MPNLFEIYDTLPEGTKLVQNKTNAFAIISIENIDLGNWWQRTGGNVNGFVKATLIKPNGDKTIKTGENGEITLVNTSPQKIKIYIEVADLDQTGKIKVLPEFYVGQGWIPAVLQEFEVIDDPTYP